MSRKNKIQERMASKEIIPSSFQKAIFDWGLNSDGNLMIEAKAGSGKTTVLITLYHLLQEKYQNEFDALFLAFNKSIIETLKKKLPEGAKCQTLNALGHKALADRFGILRMENDKYNTLAFESLKSLYIPKAEFPACLAFIKQVVALAQANLIDESNKSFIDLIEHYNLIIPKGLNLDRVLDITKNIMHTGLQLTLEKQIVSFDDQIWLPAKLKLNVPKAKFIFIDEAQDLSKAKLELVMLAKYSDSRIIAVGDKKQSIYNFSGSDIHSIDKIKERIKPTCLPLSISYRCANNIIKEAQRLVPDIRAREGAPDGSVFEIEFPDMINKLLPGDFILCRLTAPLVRTCIYLIKNKMAAKVMGSDIGKQLIHNVKSIVGKYGSWDELPKLLKQYKDFETQRIRNNNPNPESALQIIYDRVDAISAISEGFNANSLEEFTKIINDIFSDKESLITLSTIHKAKGMEAKNVFIIERQKLPLKWKNQKAWELDAEHNLEYVAITRAKENLYYVEERIYTDER